MVLFKKKNELLMQMIDSKISNATRPLYKEIFRMNIDHALLKHHLKLTTEYLDNNIVVIENKTYFVSLEDGKFYYTILDIPSGEIYSNFQFTYTWDENEIYGILKVTTHPQYFDKNYIFSINLKTRAATRIC